MIVPNRHGSSNSYRYGFNGKEMDNEIMGEGNFEDYGMRSYNPRIGRFFSIDPLTREYASLTPYQFASNSPIAGIDRDGEEFEPYWASTVPQKIKEYEKDLYKKDPKHAEEIIKQHNVDAFLFVCGGLTAGNSILATAFMDGTFSYGGYKAVKGTLNNKPKEVLEGAKIMGSILAVEFGGIVIGKIVSKALPLVKGASEISTMKPSYTMNPEEFFASGSIQKAIGKVKGVYKFTMEDGTSIYVGKAGGVDGLAQRVKASYNEVVNGTKTVLPKAGPNAVLKKVEFYEFDPLKFKDVDAMERTLIKENGGIENLINKRNAKKE